MRTYKWWTVLVTWPTKSKYWPSVPTIKLGPLTVFTYKSTFCGRRVSWTWMAGQEHILWESVR